MCDVYRQVCGAASFQREHTISKSSEEALAHRSLGSTESAEAIHAGSRALAEVARAARQLAVGCLAEPAESLIPWDSVTDTALQDLFGLYEEHCSDR